MNNFEWMKTQDIKDLAYYLCDGVNVKIGCDDCPVSDKCHFMNNGFLAWLEEKHEEKE